MQVILNQKGAVASAGIRRRALMLMCLLTTIACTPVLDWRDTSFPEAGGLTALFPCKADRFARTVALAGRNVSLAIASCKADDATYAVSHADVADPAQVTPALIELRAALARNVGGPAAVVRDARLANATPNAQSQVVSISGHSTDGAPLQVRTLFFVRGTRVFQATVLGKMPAPEAVDTFFSSLRLGA